MKSTANDAAQRLARVRSALDDVLARSRQGSLLRSGVHASGGAPPRRQIELAQSVLAARSG